MKLWTLLSICCFLVACETSSVEKSKIESSIQSRPNQLSLIPRGLDLSKAPEKITFGSCHDQDLDQSIWDSIAKQNPDLMILTGDNVYASKPNKKPIFDQYKKMEKSLSYRKLRESVPVLATWDDHDYGMDDGDESNPEKQEARRSFAFHFPYIKDSTLLDQPGLFHSKILGGVKIGRGRRAKTTPSLHIIMLDTRWNKTAWKKEINSEGVLKLISKEQDPKATILGETQWEWLEDQLKEPSDFKILVSSIQVLTEEHSFERWGHFPKEKQKLLNLIAKTKPKNLVIFSGDRHFASISKTEISGWGPLYEITSSPMNTPKGNLTESEKVYQFPIYVKENFGSAQFDWEKGSASFEILSLDGQSQNKIELKMRR